MLIDAVSCTVNGTFVTGKWEWKSSMNWKPVRLQMCLESSADAWNQVLVNLLITSCFYPCQECCYFVSWSLGMCAVHCVGWWVFVRAHQRWGSHDDALYKSTFTFTFTFTLAEHYCNTCNWSCRFRLFCSSGSLSKLVKRRVSSV